MRLLSNPGPRYCARSAMLSRGGFTLMEMLVIMVIMGILATLSYASIGRNLPEWRVKGATNELVGVFQKARALAVKKNKFALVEFTNVGAAATSSVGLYVDENNSLTVDAGDLKQHYMVVGDKFKAAYVQSAMDGAATPGPVTTVVLSADGTVRGGTMPITIKLASTNASVTRVYQVIVERSGIARMK